MDNLTTGNSVLLNGIKNDETIKKSEWDKKVYSEICWILGSHIFPLIPLLKKTVDAKNYKENFGIYEELVLSNGGLPEFFNYRQLCDDKSVADERVTQILDYEVISSKEDMLKKWIKIANNDMLAGRDEKRKYLLEIVPDRFQAIEFYKTIKNKEIFDIRNPMSELSINDNFIFDRARVSSNFKGYILSWFNYVTGFGVWNIYIAQIEESKGIEKKGFLNSLKKDDSISENIFSNQKGYGMILFKKFLEDHMTSGPFFLARDMDKTFETLYPKKISVFQFGPMLTNGTCTNTELSNIFIENPDAYFLTATREDIENVGLCDKKDPIQQTIGTKCKWNVNNMVEQRFGVCSRDLEGPLKEFIKFPNMRFYLS